jgi:hypothetical protein
VLNYIYTKKSQFLNRLVYHTNRKSLVELLPKLLQIESCDVELSKEPNIQQKRNEIISEFVLKLKSNNFEVKLFLKQEVDNCITVLSDIIDNRNCLEVAIENKTFLTTLFEIVSNKQVNNLNFVESLNLLILVNKFCWVENCHMPTIAQNKGNYEFNFEDESIVSYNEKEIIHSGLSLLTKKHLLGILSHFIVENENKNFDSTFGTNYKPLGNKRIKIVEFLLTVFNLMKIAIHEIDALLVDKENVSFFNLLLNFFFDYEWNNFYQQNFEGLMNFILQNSTSFPSTIKYVITFIIL